LAYRALYSKKRSLINDATNENEERKRPGVARLYRNDQISVSWEPGLCIHVGECFRRLPQVFQPETRPWIKVEAAEADQIAQVVISTTGALHFERLDGGAQESRDEKTTIQARVNGPLFVRGNVRILGPGSHLIREDTRLALCRCGHSANKPFYDGTHRRIRSRSEVQTDPPMEGE
jgi:CDGSH-type Zn-finger protein/uncharacterized Fe-S cluster protein YjdI